MFYLKKATHSHNPIASLSMSVITYCHQKNLLRVRTKPHIRLCKDWSSQRFKSLPSILCKIGFVHNRLPDENQNFNPKYYIDRRFEPSSGVERAAALRLLLVLFVEAKRIKPSPFGNFWQAESSPLLGRHASRAKENRGLQASNQRTQVAVSCKPIKSF